VAAPVGDGNRYSLFDRRVDPGETRDLAASRPDEFRVPRRELELLQERSDREWTRTRGLLEGRPAPPPLSPETCEKLRALGYVPQGCPS
jgi:hypothetical protein